MESILIIAKSCKLIGGLILMLVVGYTYIDFVFGKLDVNFYDGICMIFTIGILMYALSYIVHELAEDIK